MTNLLSVELTDYFKTRIPILLQLGFREAGLPALKKFIVLLWETNDEMNLISRKMTAEELMDNHVIDCLLPLAHFPKDIKTVADFGTGGGLPGIIYAIQFPEMKFRLFEKSARKQEFLQKCKTFAPNISVEGEIPSYLLEIDMIVARGFKAIDVILEMSRTAYLKKCKYFLLKARREKLDEELILARKKFKELIVNIEVLKSPVLDVERHLVQINF